MNRELTYFFTKGLIIMFLIVLGWFLLRRMSRILASLFVLWIILAILAFLVLPLIALIWAIIYLGKR